MLHEVWDIRRGKVVNDAGHRLNPNCDNRVPDTTEHRPQSREMTRHAIEASLGPRYEIHRPRVQSRVIDANDPDSVLQDVERDMDVLSSDGTRVGIVEEIRVNEKGKRTSIVVRSGRLVTRRMMVDGNLVDLVDEDRVLLSIDPRAFKLLPVA